MKKMYLVLAASSQHSATQFMVQLTAQQIDQIDMFYAQCRPEQKIQGPGLLIDYSGKDSPDNDWGQYAVPSKQA